jgi:hypothetical protein
MVWRFSTGDLRAGMFWTDGGMRMKKKELGPVGCEGIAGS